MCGGECDSYDQVDQWVRARKAHACAATGCEIGIRPGDRYHRWVSFTDGSVDEYKHCARCWAIVQALFSAGAESIDLRLNCGEIWTDNWSAAEPSHLAFMTADEAQAMLVEAKP